MYNVWVATDWHCWSKDNRDLRHPYRSVSNLGRLADNYAEEIQVDDLFIHLGDLCDPAVTDPKRLALIVSSIPCRKILCKGNHDVQPDEFYLQVGFDEVCDICKIGNIIFSHKPVRVAPDEINIHGHLHTAKLSTLGSNYINAFRSNFDTHPVLVEDLLEKAPYQDPEDWRGTELYGVEKNFEQYMSVDNDHYAKILDLTEEFDDYPLDEAAGPDDTLAQIVEFNRDFDKKFQYGLRINGRWDPKRNTTSDDWDKYLIIQSPEELEKSMVGVCWDCVSYEAWYFRKHFPKVPFKTYYMQFFDGADYPSHTILTFTLKGKHYYFEISFRKFAGVYEARSEEDIINFVLQLMSDNPDPSIPKGELLKTWKYDAWEYDALDPTLYGMRCQEYMNYVMGQGKCLHHTWHKHRHPVTRIDTSSLTESIASVLDEVLFEDPGDTEYWEQDDDYKPSTKIKEPMADGESGIVNESVLRSSVDKDHEQKGRLRLSQFPQYALTKERRKKYQPEFPNLRHFYDHGERSHDSVIWVDNNDHPVAAISVYYEKDDPHAVRDQWSGHNWIAEFEIAKDYRGYGLAKQVLHYAVRMLKADALAVADDNKLAQKVYLDYGFKMSNDTSGRNHMMYLTEGATYQDVKAIVATIPKEEHQLFYNVERNRGFVDSPYVEYRDAAYHNIRGTKHGAFIDVYADPEDASIGNIVIAAAPLARGTGIADKLVKKMLKHITSTGITTLHWTASKDNTPSIKLAERNGFYRGSDTEDGKCLYVYDVESRNAPTRFQVKEEPTTNPNDPVSSKGVKLSFYLQGEQVGEASISAVDTTTGFLYDVEVFPKFRGKGYGTEIMRYIMTNYAVTELTVEQSNTKAIKLYEKFGFTTRKKFKENGKPMYDMQYGAGISESARSDVLYHGSITKYDVLKPSIAQAYPDKARVFATPDYGFALAFAGKPWNDLEINQCTVNGRQILTEILPGKFEEKFNCSGYVHHVSSEGFYNIGSRLEQVCDMDVPVQRVDRIQNVRQALINHGVMLYAYPSLPPHIRSRVKYLKDLCTKYHINYDDIAQEYSITESYYTPPVLTEDSDFHEMDPKTKRSLMDKHGLKTPGQEHEYSVDPDADEETDPEKRLRERKEKRLKNLKKARKIKKRKAFVRKLKSHLPGVKNEEVETDPFNGDQERFFEPPDHYAEYVRFNESFHFEMLDDVKFLDPISETSDADKRLYPVYVLLIRGNSPISALISGFTQSMYTHVSISFDPTLTKMYSFAAKDKVNTLEALIGGFKTENIQAKFFKENKIPYAVYVVPSTQDEIKRMKKRLEYFIRNETKFRFDYGGLVKNYFKIEDYPENRWFCSRFVGEILNAGRPDRPYVNSPALLRPEDFRTISFARFVESGMDAAKYHASRVEKKTKAILREESLKYLSKMPAAVNESIIYDVDPLDLLSESVVECLIAQLDESAFQDFLIYLQSFKVKFDKDGNVIISRREIDQLDQRFRQTVREARAYQAAGNIEGMKECLAQTYFMIELINRHYLNPKTMQSNRVKADLKKEMTDLRSVMLNMFQQNLKWVTAREPQFNFQEYYDGSKYGKNTYIPKEVITALGTTLVTALR